VSGAVDEDVARSVASGRETLGAMLESAQKDLQKVFIAFVLGLGGTVWYLYTFGWARLRRDLLAQAPEANVIAVTPFDVILLQVKIGLIVGGMVALPMIVYYSRDALRERGHWPDHIARWKIALVVIASLLLFLGGAAYGYLLFFPVAFDFLANNAAMAGFEPTYSIVKWAQFIILLTISFGLAAQLPLAMSALAYAEIVPYETWRDYWKHAIVGMYALGALFTPPDPLTQLMWATPLVALYAFSLGVTKFVVTAKRSSEQIGFRNEARRRWNVLAGTGLVGAAAAFLVGRALLNGALDPSLARLDRVPYAGGYLSRKFPASLASDTLFGVDAGITLPVVAALVGALVALAVLVYYLFRALDRLELDPRAAPASAGDPADIDVRELDAAGVRTAPPEPFLEMEEEEALAIASDAMADDDPETAEAVLDRFDAAQEMADEEPAGEPPTEDAAAEAPAGADGDAAATGTAVGADATVPADASAAADAPDDAAPAGEGGEDAGVVTSTTAGMVDAFTEEETTEEEIGGYYYDVAFVLESLTSKAFRIVGVFMGVMALTFYWLYTGGINDLREQFVSRLPDVVVADQVNIVTLHPVEALVFMIKVSVIFGLVAALPILLYYAWPALKERGFAAGDRRVLLVWGGTTLATLTLGSLAGFLSIAPAVISWLAADVLQANMVIAYRINNFGWLVFFTTVGVGILFMIPVSMLMFHHGGLVSVRAMRDRWRVVTLGVFAIVAFLSPRGVFVMFLLGIPVMAFYGLGLALLWVTTRGGRRGRPPEPVEPAD
jgi:sec-independent protein translocase protein TatC